MSTIETILTEFSEKLLPRMLTQVCRDAGSPAYGSFDRNWWHYKIRDFSSIILQQGGYALFCASQMPGIGAEKKASLRDLAAGSCRFWNLRAKKFRSFEEYYPWEEGYPPVAFSTLAVAKLAAEGVIAVEEIMPGLKVAAEQLLHRFEPKATNQQVAGTAALCWIRKIAPDLIDEATFASICEKTLACQRSEGWYMEYGGPDLGYLSVTMDCLWDAYDATADERFKASAAKGLEFIAAFTALPTRGAGMHNARNTDYIVPYGIARFLNESEFFDCAANTLNRIYEKADHPGHFLHAVDDRYYCHYIGHSIFRALPLLKKMSSTKNETFLKTQFFEGTGHWLLADTPSGCSALVSSKKGAIATFCFGEATVTDYGWVLSDGKQEWVSHWWADFWETKRTENEIMVSGFLTPHSENESAPLKHMALRGLSLIFGRKIIGLLKDKLIFKERASSPYTFTRSIRFDAGEITVCDEFKLDEGMTFKRAPRSSKRHVASADSYHDEDCVSVGDGVIRKETRSEKDGVVKVETTYQVKS
jgi:hypothetical protein